jgi:mono/diheme cytochrome c family protein
VINVTRLPWIVLLAISVCGSGPLAQAQEAAADAAPVASGTAPGPDPVRGRRAFQRYCGVCHGTQGEGGLGPSLQGISTRLTSEEITHQIVEPRGSMPRLYPSPVDGPILGDLLAFLGRLR